MGEGPVDVVFDRRPACRVVAVPGAGRTSRGPRRGTAGPGRVATNCASRVEAAIPQSTDVA